MERLIRGVALPAATAVLWMAAVSGCFTDRSGKAAGGGPTPLDASPPRVDGGSGRADAGGGRDGGSPPGDGGGRDAAEAPVEVCDGADNDDNGIIDDVDVGGDGVCDCLRIATIGVPGVWGGGNVLEGWLDARIEAGATHLGDQRLTPAVLANYQILVAQDVRSRRYTNDEIRAVVDWVAAGGGFMTLIGYGAPTEVRNVNRLLNPLGLEYDDEPILVGIATVPVRTWHDHPVAEGVMQIGVNNGYEVTGDGEVIAEEDDYVLMRGVSRGLGRVLAWGDEWVGYESALSEHPDYQLERFWINSLKWLTPPAECQVPIP